MNSLKEVLESNEISEDEKRQFVINSFNQLRDREQLLHQAQLFTPAQIQDFEHVLGIAGDEDFLFGEEEIDFINATYTELVVQVSEYERANRLEAENDDMDIDDPNNLQEPNPF